MNINFSNALPSSAAVHEFLFHPLSKEHSRIKKIVSVIVYVALSVFSAGIYAAIVLGVNLYEKKTACHKPNDVVKKIEYRSFEPLETTLAQEVRERQITQKELAQHNTSKDIWIAIAGLVFNVTKFLEDHPGGDDILLVLAGRDATHDFSNIGHSPEAHKQAMKYCIGYLVK